MAFQSNNTDLARPAASLADESECQAAFAKLLDFCKTSHHPFSIFETKLLVLMAALGVCLIRLFLSSRSERLDLAPYLAGQYRLGSKIASRTIGTFYGKVKYARQYLIDTLPSAGHFFPLDRELGLSRDRLSPWVMQWVARLATRMSFKATRMTCRAVLNWAPATETIERVVLGMGRDAAPFMKQLEAPPEDGEVLVIEIDGKCAPMASEEELNKRRGKRKPACPLDCKCQRHRGKEQRKKKGSKKRRAKSDKRKNGKEVTVVVMYTLKRGADGKLHGPINKKVYGTFVGREAAAKWARAEATKRGFDKDTTKTIQFVMDGAGGVPSLFLKLFPKAIYTLDVCHAVERLWAVGRHFHKEVSVELRQWMEPIKELLYAGEVEKLLARLQQLLDAIPKQGPGNLSKRESLQKEIWYISKRKWMMKYGEWREADLVIASGQVEGAVRQLVGERFDCSGMRWVRGKAEALLHLRCIELNGDWDAFARWFARKVHAKLRKGKRVQVFTDQPLPMPKPKEKPQKKAA